MEILINDKWFECEGEYDYIKKEGYINICCDDKYIKEYFKDWISIGQGRCILTEAYVMDVYIENDKCVYLLLDCYPNRSASLIDTVVMIYGWCKETK